MRAQIDRRAIAALSGRPFATDFAGGALPALLPAPSLRRSGSSRGR